jgi:hypothetical protein
MQPECLVSYSQGPTIGNLEQAECSLRHHTRILYVPFLILSFDSCCGLRSRFFPIESVLQFFYYYYFISEMHKCFSLSNVRLTDHADLQYQGTPYSLMSSTHNGMVTLDMTWLPRNQFAVRAPCVWMHWVDSTKRAELLRHLSGVLLRTIEKARQITACTTCPTCPFRSVVRIWAGRKRV